MGKEWTQNLLKGDTRGGGGGGGGEKLTKGNRNALRHQRKISPNPTPLEKDEPTKIGRGKSKKRKAANKGKGKGLIGARKCSPEWMRDQNRVCPKKEKEEKNLGNKILRDKSAGKWKEIHHSQSEKKDK